MRNLVLYAIAALLLFGAQPQCSYADPLIIGNLSFDSGVSPSFNTFDLSNYTGGFNPQSGIADNELFSGILTITLASGTTNYTFNGVGSISALSPIVIASVPNGTAVLSATLSLVLSNSASVNIFDASGTAGVADLLTIGNISIPSVGSSFALTPCDGSAAPCSSSVITVDATSPSAVPEPQTLCLLLTGVGAGVGLIRRKLRP